jgi:hypothetical protein
MNKRSVLFVALGLLIVCLAIIVVSHEQREMPWGEMAGATAGTDSKKDLLHGKEDSVDMNLESIPVVSPDPEEQASYVKLFKEVMGWGRTPIKFYGRVVDEAGRAIEGADIDYSLTDSSPEGRTMYHMVSGSDGNFTIKDAKGKNLIVRVSKNGYYQFIDSRRGFQYAGVGGNFSPDPNHPEIFRLHKMGERVPLVKATRSVDLPADGEPISLNLYTLQPKKLGGGEYVQFQAQRVSENGRARFQFILRVPGGGIQESKHEMEFMAPESGYQEELLVEAPSPEFRKKTFFLKFGSGNFAKISLSLVPHNRNIGVESFLNPDGSRNLENDPNRWISVRAHLDHSISLIYPKDYQSKTPSASQEGYSD